MTLKDLHFLLRFFPNVQILNISYGNCKVLYNISNGGNDGDDRDDNDDDNDESDNGKKNVGEGDDGIDKKEGLPACRVINW